MGQPRTVTISIPPDLAKQVERVARAEGRTRSELFREAVRQYLDRRDRWERILEHGRERARGKDWTEETVVEAVKEVRRARRRA